MLLSRYTGGSNAGAGFTLVELLVVLAVAAILLSVAAPGFGDFLRENRASALVNDYIYALRVARSEAVTERIPTAVCQSDDLGECTQKTDWATGWLVFQDLNDDGDCAGAADGTCDDGGRVLLAHSPDAEGFEFGSGDKNGKSHVSYGPSGFAMGQNETFNLCDKSARIEARAVVLNITGRIRSGDAEDADCS